MLSAGPVIIAVIRSVTAARLIGNPIGALRLCL
jgi:hypothetical protein